MPGGSPGACVPRCGATSSSRRRMRSRPSTSVYTVSAFCAAAREARLASDAPAPATRSATSALPKLRINLLKIVAVDEHLARFSARTGRHEPLGLHHVDEPGCAAEPNPELSLQVRDRRLPGTDDNPRCLVVQIVLLELKALRSALVVLSGNRFVVYRLALFPQEA